MPPTRPVAQDLGIFQKYGLDAQITFGTSQALQLPQPATQDQVYDLSLLPLG